MVIGNPDDTDEAIKDSTANSCSNAGGGSLLPTDETQSPDTPSPSGEYSSYIIFSSLGEIARQNPKTMIEVFHLIYGAKCQYQG